MFFIWIHEIRPLMIYRPRPKILSFTAIRHSCLLLHLLHFWFGLLQMWQLGAFLTRAPPLYLDAPSFIWPTPPREEAFENRPIDFQFISLLWGFEAICGCIAGSFTLCTKSTKCALTISSKSTFGRQLFNIIINSFIFGETVKNEKYILHLSRLKLLF